MPTKSFNFLYISIFVPTSFCFHYFLLENRYLCTVFLVLSKFVIGNGCCNSSGIVFIYFGYFLFFCPINTKSISVSSLPHYMLLFSRLSFRTTRLLCILFSCSPTNLSFLFFLHDRWSHTSSSFVCDSHSLSTSSKIFFCLWPSTSRSITTNYTQYVIWKWHNYCHHYQSLFLRIFTTFSSFTSIPILEFLEHRSLHRTGSPIAPTQRARWSFHRTFSRQ